MAVSTKDEAVVIEYVLLGAIQGLTEFLPVSSSAHLVIAERLLGLDPPGVLLEALLHWGTLAAIVVALRKDLSDIVLSLYGRGSLERRREIGLLLAGTVPIVVVGLVARSKIDQVFSSLWSVAIGLLLTAAALGVAQWRRRHADRSWLRFGDAMAVGLAQAASLVPGISRSGLTISTAVARGVAPRAAARFSFLLSIPALFGAGLVTLMSGTAREVGTTFYWPGLIVGVFTAFVVGLVTIRTLLYVIARRGLWVFAAYCAVVSVFVIVGWLI